MHKTHKEKSKIAAPIFSCPQVCNQKKTVSSPFAHPRVQVLRYAIKNKKRPGKAQAVFPPYALTGPVFQHDSVSLLRHSRMFTQCIIHANRVTVLGVLHDFRMNIIQLQQLLFPDNLLCLPAV